MGQRLLHGCPAADIPRLRHLRQPKQPGLHYYAAANSVPARFDSELWGASGAHDGIRSLEFGPENNNANMGLKLSRRYFVECGPLKAVLGVFGEKKR